MADEQDRLRRQLGLAPLSTTSTAPVVDERTQRAAMAAASATPVPISTEPKLYYNYYTGEYVDDPSKIKPRTGMGGPESGGAPIQVEASSSSSSDEGYWIHDAAKDTTNPDGTINWNEYWSTDKSRTRVTRVTPQVFGSSSSSSGGGKTVTGTYTDPATGDVYLVYSDGSKVLQAKGTKAADAATAKAAADAAARAGRQSAYDLLFQQFDAYGLGALVSPLKGLIESGISPAEFTIKLRETDAYKKRFAANSSRIQKGLRALSEAEYIGLEDQYQDVMRRYGLPDTYYARGDMGRQEGFEKFIGGDVSPVELEDRIQTAQNRVINTNPEVSKALREFYPEITGGDILAYALDPAQAINNIKRKVGAAEIGAGAMQAGLQTGLARAEELQRYGVTKETARQGFGTISSGLERGRQLSNIYQQPTYTQEVAETEVFALPDAEKARRQRRRLGQLETATFSGTTGMTGGALDRERAGQY
jgi:hypothetical protein